MFNNYATCLQKHYYFLWTVYIVNLQNMYVCKIMELLLLQDLWHFRITQNYLSSYSVGRYKCSYFTLCDIFDNYIMSIRLIKVEYIIIMLKKNFKYTWNIHFR